MNKILFIYGMSFVLYWINDAYLHLKQDGYKMVFYNINQVIVFVLLLPLFLGVQIYDEFGGEYE